MAMTGNIPRLISAGILSPDAELSTDDQNALNSLTEAEVDTIISVKNKLGPVFFEKHVKPKAAFIF